MRECSCTSSGASIARHGNRTPPPASARARRPTQPRGPPAARLAAGACARRRPAHRIQPPAQGLAGRAARARGRARRAGSRAIRAPRRGRHPAAGRTRRRPGGRERAAAARRPVRVHPGRLRGGLRVLHDRADGLLRQLGSGEIVAQVALARRLRRVHKVVFMGMGEPAHNLDAVLDAIELLGTEGAVAAQEPGVVDRRRPARLRAPAADARSSRRSRCRCTPRARSCAPRCCRAPRASTRPSWSSSAKRGRARAAIRSSTNGR
jgi:hypothetical protein